MMWFGGKKRKRSTKKNEDGSPDDSDFVDSMPEGGVKKDKKSRSNNATNNDSQSHSSPNSSDPLDDYVNVASRSHSNTQHESSPPSAKKRSARDQANEDPDWAESGNREKVDKSRKAAATNKKRNNQIVQPAETEPVYCICRLPNTGEPMIECDKCNEWYHFRCVGMSAEHAARLSHYVCARCEAPATRTEDNAAKKRKRAEEENVKNSGSTAQIPLSNRDSATGEKARSSRRKNAAGPATTLEVPVIDEGDGTGKWIDQLTGVESDSDEDEYVYMTSDDDSPIGPQSLNVPVPERSFTARLIEDLPSEKRNLNAPLFTRPDHTVHRLVVDIEDRAEERHHRIPAFNQPFLHFPLMMPRPLSFSEVFEECGTILDQIRHQNELKDCSGYRLIENSMILNTYHQYQSMYHSIGLMYERAERVRHRWLLAQEWSLHQSIYPHVDHVDSKLESVEHTIPELENELSTGLDTLLSDALPLGLGHQTFHDDAQVLIDQVIEHARENNQPIDLTNFRQPNTHSSHHSFAPMSPHKTSLNPSKSFASPAFSNRRLSIAVDNIPVNQTILERIDLDNLYCIGCHGYVPVHDYADHLESCSTTVPLDEDVHLINLAPYTVSPPRPVLPFLNSQIIHPAKDSEQNLKLSRMSEQHAWRTPAGELIHFPSLCVFEGIVCRDYDKTFYTRRELAVEKLREHEKELNASVNQPVNQSSSQSVKSEPLTLKSEHSESQSSDVKPLKDDRSNNAMDTSSDIKQESKSIDPSSSFIESFSIDESVIPRPILSAAAKRELREIVPSVSNDHAIRDPAPDVVAQPFMLARHFLLDPRAPLPSDAIPSANSEDLAYIPLKSNAKATLVKFVAPIINPDAIKYEVMRAKEVSWITGELGITSDVRADVQSSKLVCRSHRLLTPEFLPTLRCGFPLDEPSFDLSINRPIHPNIDSLTPPHFMHCNRLRSECQEHAAWDEKLRRELELSVNQLHTRIDVLAKALVGFGTWFESYSYTKRVITEPGPITPMTLITKAVRQVPQRTVWKRQNCPQSRPDPAEKNRQSIVLSVTQAQAQDDVTQVVEEEELSPQPKDESPPESPVASRPSKTESEKPRKEKSDKRKKNKKEEKEKEKTGEKEDRDRDRRERSKDKAREKKERKHDKEKRDRDSEDKHDKHESARKKEKKRDEKEKRRKRKEKEKDRSRSSKSGSKRDRQENSSDSEGSRNGYDSQQDEFRSPSTIPSNN